MVGQSFAASKLCAWSVNIVTFNKIFKEVKPLQIAEAKSKQELKGAEEELAKVKEEVRKLNEMVTCLLYTSPSPRDQRGSRMPSSA